MPVSCHWPRRFSKPHLLLWWTLSPSRDPCCVPDLNVSPLEFVHDASVNDYAHPSETHRFTRIGRESRSGDRDKCGDCGHDVEQRRVMRTEAAVLKILLGNGDQASA